ncbi:type 12 methyltransferase [Psychromonas sp. CNPT3]|uniref:glycosyltransferase n=1 Tax=Psychromonas sp. CNPT3 TaxID=314282 RepID=UPI0002C13387|nr:glycosyltransferase [Psychromonas sp. CNPT3]AGH81033.1 type 12 methyltransferase [Psychromonas sp. CNPT3]
MDNNNLDKLKNDYIEAITVSEKRLISFIGMEALYKNQLIHNAKLIKKNENLYKDLDKYKTNFMGMDSRNKSLQSELERMKETVGSIKNTLSFRWGNRLVNSTESFIVFLKLPFHLYKEYKDFKCKRKIIVKQLSRIVVKRSEKNKLVLPINLNELKVASIMDEFTFNSFKYECNLLQLTPKTWRGELEKFQPNLLFIESAWKGKDDLWIKKVSNCESELVELVQYCHENKIHTIFWNKEDPVHFDTFSSVAKIVDHVFTTDIDCVPRYKKIVNHNNVNFLPFAAQPMKHNPIEIYKRKDAFNFAGSYYLRYPERQRDFSSLISAVKKFKPVDIYDRNFDNSHKNYLFPDSYQSMILGKLPFEEIDKAYKGYRYGINMNTIKQSQSMFARRVFELLASNTIVVSNYSRGMRLLFGDLVLSSDNSNQIEIMLKKICDDGSYYKKLRLLGLRKVMSEHTYADRLAFILSKINNFDFKKTLPFVYLYANVDNKEEFDSVINSFKKQTYSNKKLIVCQSFKSDLQLEHVIIKSKISDCLKYLQMIQEEGALFGVLEPKDYYGKSYLVDLVSATIYGDYPAFGKGCFYEYKQSIILNGDGRQYKATTNLDIRSSLVKLKQFNKKYLQNFLNNKYSISDIEMLAIDEFNYCKNGANANKTSLNKVEDLILVDQGVSFIEKLAKISDGLQPREKKIKSDSSLPSFSAEKLFNLFAKPISSKIKINFIDNKMRIITKLGNSNHTYIYTKKSFGREELNMIINSQFTLLCKSSLENMYTVFEFQDKDGKKISHSINPIGDTHTIAIPVECRYIRLGLKLVGNGTVAISKLILGSHGELPFSIVGKSKKLVLTKQYPSYNDIYKYGFLHSRVRAYKKEGLLVDVFRINDQSQLPYREFENIDIATGNAALLNDTLNTGQYDHVLVHLMDEKMWNVLEKHIDKVKVTVWLHGAEIQDWTRRKFDLEDLTKEEIARKKKLCASRLIFWKKLIRENHKNVHFVFVSNTFRKEVEVDLDLQLDKNMYSVIHNYVDEDIFRYFPKEKKDRLKIFSVRSFASKKYGNDLTTQAIEMLSKEKFFNELEFLIIGDGPCFKKDTQALEKFENVKIEQKFLTHAEIAEIQKKHGIFMNPTRWDSQGVSRDEAMSSGLVVVTNNVAAIPEFVDNSCGMVVASEDYIGMAKAINTLYYNPDKFLTLSIAANERVVENLNLEKTILEEIKIIS